MDHIPIPKNQIVKAIKIAKNVRSNAFVLKHNPKGACVITDDNKFYGGCNIESNVSGLGLCAERCAIDHAVVHGNYDFKAIVVYDDSVPTYPCGACLQYLNLFTQINGANLQIISAHSVDDYTQFSFKELLPMNYISRSSEGLLKKYHKHNQLQSKRLDK